jgi:Holliday junction resolvase RusA-like endonuclease
MKNRIQFDVIGKPYGQKRPRAFRRGKFLGIYAPKENVEYSVKVVNALTRLVRSMMMCHWLLRYKRSSRNLN